MTIQSSINSEEVAPRRQFSWPLALVILILGIVLGVFASNITALANKTEVATAPERISRDAPVRPNLLELEKQTLGTDAARAQAAETARYNSLGLFYAAGNEQPALAAETDRYKGLAGYYRESALAAETARYEGLTEYYNPRSPAWPPRPAQFHSAGNTEMNLAGMANADSDLGLMDFSAAKEGHIEAANQPHSLAWPPRPNQFFSEKNGVESDPNTDIGLME